jgi:translation initiation factor IF-2
MANVRVFGLARELGKSSQDVIERLRQLGVEAKTASSSVDEETADKLRRALKIDALTRARKRVYGSEEDEDDRERVEREREERIAAERSARAQAAEEARIAAEERKAGRRRAARPAEKPAAEAPAIAHAPGAPRLAPRAPARPTPVVEEPVEAVEVAAAVEEEQALPPPPPRQAPAAPAVVRTTVTAPRLAGPVRPIAPPAASVAAPPASPAGVSARPSMPRQVRPIAPPRPSSPHPVATTPLPRSPHAVGWRPGAPPGAPYARPGLAGRPAPRPKAKDKARGVPPPPKEEHPVYTGPLRKIRLSEGVTVKELGEKMEDVKSREIMKALIARGVMATVNQSLDPPLAIEICREFGYEATVQSFEDELVEEQTEISRPEDLEPRAPVITVMGHVDHGKTSLLDAIRETSVAVDEAGGITQHIGAYHVDVGNRKVVFLDTPGHEAFTLMRARGARVTDIVVLVVAADDGVMPQTLEAIDHAKAAGVPIVVAVNKVDKPEAQPDRVRKQLSDYGLMPEEWGGSTVFVDVSAKKRQNLDQLLEMLLLVADLQEIKANRSKSAVGTVLEARLDKGRGPVATVLVQDGTLRVGETVVAGAVAGKIRALSDDRGQRLKQAGPATPVELLGLPSLPEPGDQLLAVTDSLKAQSIVSFRQLKMREKALAASSRIKLEDLGRAIAEGELKELLLVLKADVQGSLEAVADQLSKLPQEKIKLHIIRQGVGAITEGDVLLAAASNAVVIGFNVRPERKAAEIAERDHVEMQLYTVIYDIGQDIKKAMEGLLEPKTREMRLGSAEVREIFKISRVGTIAGCYVAEGKATRAAQVRLLRDNVVIHTGRVGSLRRFKDDASEVKAGLECGVGIAGYNDVKPADVIEFFTTEKVKETLE